MRRPKPPAPRFRPTGPSPLDGSGTTIAQRSLFGVGALLCVVVAIVSFRYLVGGGFVLPLIPLNTFKNPFLLVHVAGAATALLIMPLQLMPTIRRTRPAMHRWVGRVYVVACIIGSISGFMLALGTAAGHVAGTGFALLAASWFAATVLGWRAARQRRFTEHRGWMIRSFALTFAAVTLRLEIPLVLAADLPFLPSYEAIAFLCWIPNLIVAELYLRGRLLPWNRPAIAGE